MEPFDVTDARSVEFVWLSLCCTHTLWGNDIGHTEAHCGLLTYQIKATFVSLFIEILPGCPIILSSILPRI